MRTVFNNEVFPMAMRIPATLALLASSLLASATASAYDWTFKVGAHQVDPKSDNGTLAGGTYWFNSLTINGTMSFSGAATIYVNGNITFGNGGTLTAYQSIPSNLRVYQIGADRLFETNNNASITAIVIAPRSDFVSKNNVVFRGACVFDTIECKNNADWFFDETAGEVTALAIVQ